MSKYINLNRLEFAVTYQCNSKCKHCSVMEKKHSRNHIDTALAVEVVRQVSQRYHLESIMTFGGEPLLYPDIVCDIHKEALKAGIMKRSIITNGFWTKDAEKNRVIANSLIESGVNSILISVDAFHQEYIPIEIVKNTAKCLLQAGIEKLKWNPCWIVAESGDNLYDMKTRLILKELSDLQIDSTRGNVVEPEGAAVVNLEEYMPPKCAIPVGSCGDMPYTDPLDAVRSICIEPSGDVHICRGVSIGNIYEKDISLILEEYDPYKGKSLKVIREEGMEGLVKYAKTNGVAIDKQGYYSICHMCTSLRKQMSI